MNKKKEFIFCPLGGSGEIGMNMNLFAYGNQENRKWIIVDIGVTFADDSIPGVDLIYPDPGFIVDKKNDLLGLVLTHAHEDHIGAIAHIWPKLMCDIYATPFTSVLIKEKFREKKIDLGNKLKIVKINIKNKKQVGSDRLANAVGVFKKYKTNSIVLDFGTATTFDVINKQGVYNGGVIAPGINLSIKSLSGSADQIPMFLMKKQKKTIGKNTIEALRSGFYWGYVGLINNIIFKIEKETKKKYRVIFTGGYADLFKTSIKRPFTIDKNITINGIIEIFKKNKKYWY